MSNMDSSKVNSFKEHSFQMLQESLVIVTREGRIRKRKYEWDYNYLRDLDFY